MSTDQEAFSSTGSAGPGTKDKASVLQLGPQRERGLWSFLTWSFFLSQIMASQAFAGAAAHAAEGTDVSAPDSLDASGGRAGNTLADLDHSRSAIEEAGSGTDAVTALLPGRGDVADPQVNFAGAAETSYAPGANGTIGQAGWGVGGVSGPSAVGEGNSEQSRDAGDPSVVIDGGGLTSVLEGVVDGALAPLLGAVNNLIEPLNPLLDQTLSPVIGAVDELLTGLNPILDQTLTPVFATAGATVDGLLSPIGETVGDVASQFQPVFGLVSTAAETATQPVLNLTATVADGVSGFLGSPLTSSSDTDIVASAGDIQFSANITGGTNDLFANGLYTNYGVALHADYSSDPVAGVDIELNGNLQFAISAADFTTDYLSQNGLPLTLTGAVDETAMRNLGDSWI